MNVLVTSGATREPIDSVRFISNISSGRTGAAICEALAARGFGVTQVYGTDSAVAEGIFRHEAFSDFGSLDGILRRLLSKGDFDAVIHAAAVGDYSVAGSPAARKLDSGQELVLQLQPNPKIIDRLRDYAGGREFTLIGFKLTDQPHPAGRARAAQELLARSRADYVVQNDVATLASGAGHKFVIHARAGVVPMRCAGRQALASTLIELLERQETRSPA